jgi:hypothetical protein
MDKNLKAFAESLEKKEGWTPAYKRSEEEDAVKAVASPSLSLRRYSQSVDDFKLPDSGSNQLPDDRVSLVSFSDGEDGGEDDDDEDDDEDDMSRIAAAKSGGHRSSNPSPPPPPAPTSVQRGRGNPLPHTRMMPPRPPPTPTEHRSDFHVEVEVEAEEDGCGGGYASDQSINERDMEDQGQAQTIKEDNQFTSVRAILAEATDSSDDSSDEGSHMHIRPPPRPTPRRSKPQQQQQSSSTKEAKEAKEGKERKEGKEVKDHDNNNDPQLLDELQRLREEMQEIRALATSRKDNDEYHHEQDLLRTQKRKEREEWKKKQIKQMKDKAALAGRRIRSSSSRAGAKIARRLHQSTTWRTLTSVCSTMVCVHCVPWCCLSLDRVEEKEMFDGVGKSGKKSGKSGKMDGKMGGGGGSGGGGEGGHYAAVGHMIYARSVVSVGWLHLIVSVLFGSIATISLLTMSYNKRLHNTQYGFSLLFLSAIKSMSLLCVSGMYFRNVDTRACFRCCLNDRHTKSGKQLLSLLLLLSSLLTLLILPLCVRLFQCHRSSRWSWK